MYQGYPEDWGKRRRRVLKRDNYKCQSCGKTGGWSGNTELHVHHILPKSEGGGHELDNLTTVCDRCHAAIHDDPRLRAKQKSGLLARLFGNGKDGSKTRKKREEGVSRLKREVKKRKKTRNESSQEKGYWHQRVEAAYNEEFNGCGVCGRELLTVNWRSQGTGKVKVIECEACRALFQEQVVSNGTEKELSLEHVDDASEIESFSSAFEYELNKHLELGTFDNRDIDEFEEKLLSEADTQQERELIKSKFKQFISKHQISNSHTEETTDSQNASTTHQVGRTDTPQSQSDGESNARGPSESNTVPGTRDVDWIDETITETEPRKIRLHIENSRSRNELKSLLERALGDEYNRQITNSLRNDFMRAFFRRINIDPRNVEFLSDSTYEGLVAKHGDKYALASALNYYFTNQGIRGRAAVKSLSKTVLASMITAIYLHDTTSDVQHPS